MCNLSYDQRYKMTFALLGALLVASVSLDQAAQAGQISSVQHESAAVAVKCQEGEWHLLDTLDPVTARPALPREVSESLGAVTRRLSEWIPSAAIVLENGTQTTSIADGTYDLTKIASTAGIEAPQGCELRNVAVFLRGETRLFMDRELLGKLSPVEQELSLIRARLSVGVSLVPYSSDNQIALRSWFQRKLPPYAGQWMTLISKYGIAPMWAGLPIRQKQGYSWKEVEFAPTDCGYGCQTGDSTLYFQSHFLRVDLSQRYNFSINCGDLSPQDATFTAVDQNCVVQLPVKEIVPTSNASPIFKIFDPGELDRPFIIVWDPIKGGSLITDRLALTIKTPWFKKGKITSSAIYFDGDGKIYAGGFYLDGRSEVALTGLAPDVVRITADGFYPIRIKPESTVIGSENGDNEVRQFRLSYLGKTYALERQLLIDRHPNAEVAFSFKSADILDLAAESILSLRSSAKGCYLSYWASPESRSLKLLTASCQDGQIEILREPHSVCRGDWNYSVSEKDQGTWKIEAAPHKITCDRAPITVPSWPGVFELLEPQIDFRTIENNNHTRAGVDKATLRLNGKDYLIENTAIILDDSNGRSSVSIYSMPNIDPAILPKGIVTDSNHDDLMFVSTDVKEMSLSFEGKATLITKSVCADGRSIDLTPDQRYYLIWSAKLNQFVLDNYECQKETHL